MERRGYYLVDLDGTLAKYEGWVSNTHIGEPVPAMLAKVKEMIAEGKDVRIFTARVAPATILDNHGDNSIQDEIQAVVKAIVDWSLEHVGKMLPITATKDYMAIAYYDDRAIQIVPNQGVRADGLPL